MTAAKKLDVLVVDDETALATAIGTALTRRGHQVEVVGAADEALLRAPQVLVADLNLGGSSGLDLLSAFHARGERPHTIFVAGDPTLRDCRRALLLGAAEFLPKPFRLEELVRAVERAPRQTARIEPETADFERSFLSGPNEIAQTLRDLLAFALRIGFGPAARARIGSATSEILDNSRRHAYERRAGPIRVRASLEARELIVTIRDQGRGFDSDDPTLFECPARNGLARALALSEALSVESAPVVGTRVALRFAAWRADFDGAVGIDVSDLDYLDPAAARRVLHAVLNPNSLELSGVSPALAVVVGRLLAGPDPLARKHESWI